VTLEEIYHGCVKKMKIARRVLQPDGTPKKEDKYVTISVKPGWKSGTKVTFQKEGDQNKGRIPADIVFIIRDKPHPLFKREGSDLRYTARLTLKQVRAMFTCFFLLKCAREIMQRHLCFTLISCKGLQIKKKKQLIQHKIYEKKKLFFK
jgi:DnaJ C terminal domain